MKKFYSLLILLTLALSAPSALAQQVVVVGYTYAGPLTGVTAYTTTDGQAAVHVGYQGVLEGADGWTVSTFGQYAVGLYADQGGIISGTNMDVTTTNPGSHGVMVNSGQHYKSMVSLVSSTIRTEGDNAFGLFVTAGGGGVSGSISGSGLYVHTIGSNSDGICVNGADSVVDITNSEFVLEHATSALVRGWNKGTVTLTNVKADTIGSGLILNGDAFYTGQLITLNINESILNGNLFTDNMAGVVNLAQGSTLTGKSTHSNHLTSGMTLNIENGSRWKVKDDSTLTTLKNEGVLDLSETGASLKISSIGSDLLANKGNFTQTTDGTTLMALSGNGPTSALITADGMAFLAGTLDISMSNWDDAVGKTFTLVQWGGRIGTFEEFLLNGVDIWQAGTAWTFDDMLIDSWLVSGSVSYVGNTLTLTITDAVIPEPGVWALMLGGVGVLGYLQRRRNRK